MNQLTLEKKVQIIGSLVEGNSIRATCRMTGAAKGTVTRLLASVGNTCAEYQDKTLRNLPCKTIERDEVWSFCFAKEKNVPKKHKDQIGYGDIWTWTALNANSKLIPCWAIESRKVEYTHDFINDLKS